MSQSIVLTKDELQSMLENEVRIVLHLMDKVEPGMLDYRPSPQQRSTLELLQYLAMVGPVQLRFIRAGNFAWDLFRAEWQQQEPTVRRKGFEETRDAIAKQPAMIREALDSMSDSDVRTEVEMFGQKASRGKFLVQMVYSHYVAYRMQLFLYLKGSGRPDLTTANAWMGKDPE